MNKIISVVIVCTLLICCNKSNKKEILTEKEFKTILKEMVEAECFVSGYVIKDTTKKHKIETQKLYEKIFELHKTNKQQVNNSISYYLQNPQQFKVMLDSMQLLARKLDIAVPLKVEAQ